MHGPMGGHHGPGHHRRPGGFRGPMGGFRGGPPPHHHDGFGGPRGPMYRPGCSGCLGGCLPFIIACVLIVAFLWNLIF